MEQCIKCKLSRNEIDDALKPLIDLAHTLGIRTTHVVYSKGVRLLPKKFKKTKISRIK